VSYSDGIKEEIGWLKLIFGGLMAIDVSLIAWVGQDFAVLIVSASVLRSSRWGW